MKLCGCGSGKPRYDLTDAAGIFCQFVCVDCEAKVRKKYNPAIFEEGSSYAASGEEKDLV